MNIKVKLKPCCRETIESIRDIQEVTKSMKKLLLGTPLLQIFTASKIAELAFTVSTTDFEGLAGAAGNLSKIARLKCYQLCQFEEINHNGPLGTFWREMRKSFEK